MPIVDISECLLELGLTSSPTDEERAIISTCITRAEGAVKSHLRYDPASRSRTEFYPQRDSSSGSRSAVWESEGNSAILRNLVEGANQELQVQHVPIRESPAIDLRIDYDGRSGTSSGAFAAESLKTEGSDFWPNYDGQDSSGNGVCRDGIIRSFGTWPSTPGTVRIVYTAGYSAAELHGQDSIIDASPILDAVIEEVARRVRKIMVQKKQASVGWVAGPFRSERLGDYSYQTDGALTAQLLGGLAALSVESMSKLEPFVNHGFALCG